MMRTLRIVVSIIVLLAILIGLAVFNLDKLVQRNKARIVSVAEEEIGRKLEVDKVGVSLWGGIGVTLSGLKASDDPRFSDKYFLSLKGLKVNVELLPLFRKRFRVKNVVLHEPVIRVIKNAKGEFNFESLLKRKNNGANKDGKKREGGEGGETLNITVSAVKIEDGLIEYTDRQSGTNLRLSRLDLLLNDIAFGRAVKVKLAAAVFSDNQNLRFDGKVGPIAENLDLENVSFEGGLEIKGLDVRGVEKGLPEIKGYLPRGLGLGGRLNLSARPSGGLEQFNVSNLKFSASVFGSSKPNLMFRGNLSDVVPAAMTLKAEGKLSLDPVEFSELRRFEPLVDMAPPELSGTGPIRISSELRGSLDDLNLVASVDAGGAKIKYADMLDKPRGVAFVMDASGRIRNNEAIDLKSATIKLSGVELSSNGSIFLGNKTRINLEVKSNAADLKGLGRVIPMLGAYKASGTMDFEARVKGILGAGKAVPGIEGGLNLKGVGATLPGLSQPVSDLNSRVSFSGGSTAKIEKSSFVMGGTRFMLEGDVQSFSPLRLSYRIFSPKLRLADLVEEKSSDSLERVRMEGVVSETKGKMALTGKLSSASGNLSGFQYKDLGSRVDYSDDVLTLKDLGCHALKGLINLDARYDMRPRKPKFNFNARVKGVSATNLLAALVPRAQEMVNGKINLELKLSGRGGSSWDEIAPTLNGAGRAEILEGRLMNVNIAEETLSGLTGLKGLTMLISPDVKRKYPSIFKTRDTVFSNLNGLLNVKGGEIEINNVRLQASEFGTTASGSIGLQKAMDIRAVLTLSKSLSSDLASRAGVSKYLLNSNGIMEVPFVIKGLLPEIKPVPDVRYVSTLLERAALRKGQREVEKRLEKLLIKEGAGNGAPATGSGASGGSALKGAAPAEGGGSAKGGSVKGQSANEPQASRSPSPKEELIKEGVKGLFKLLPKGGQ